jgi:signal transduction histidine kinase
MGKSKNVSKYLWSNYVFMVCISFLLVIAALSIILILSEPREKQGLTAEAIMKDDISRIETSEIVRNRGNVDIVTSDLKVVHLAGAKGIPQGSFTMSEWTAFLTAADSIEQNVNYSIAYNEPGGFWVIVSFPVAVSVRLYIATNISDAKDLWVAVKVLLGTVLGYLCLIAAFAALYSKITSKNFIHPIHELRMAAKSIENGSYEVKTDTMQVTELEEVRRGLVHLGNELSKQENMRIEAEDNKKSLIRDISHDLKNPLTSIRGYSELCLRQGDLSNGEKQSYIQIICNNAVRANELIEGLFQYSKLESPDFCIYPVRIEMCEFLREKLVAFAPHFEAMGIQYAAEISEDEIYCMIDAPLMSRAIDNLLENTCKYNRSGAKLTVILEAEEDGILLTIMDDGIGMDSDTAEHCFDPFFRADRARNSKTGGSGLGLSIVKKIVDAHYGDIKLITEVNKGCKFVIRLKREL